VIVTSLARSFAVLFRGQNDDSRSIYSKTRRRRRDPATRGREGKNTSAWKEFAVLRLPGEGSCRPLPHVYPRAHFLRVNFPRSSSTLSPPVPLPLSSAVDDEATAFPRFQLFTAERSPPHRVNLIGDLIAPGHVAVASRVFERLHD